MDNFLYEKKVDWSLLKDGFTLPRKIHSLLRAKTGFKLNVDEKHTINIIINGISLNAQLTNVDFDREKFPNNKEIIQIRYSPNSDISQYFRKIFAKSYEIICANKSFDSKQHIKNENAPEFLRLYTSNKPDTFIGEAVVWDDKNTNITDIATSFKTKHFDPSELQQVLASYKAVFVSKQWPEEKYKWIAVKHFQDNWDIDAPDFAVMLKEALAKTGNLLISAGLKNLLKLLPNRFVQCFWNFLMKRRILACGLNHSKRNHSRYLIFTVKMP